jgi:DNA-binding NarL/FixJ family response regulator
VPSKEEFPARSKRRKRRSARIESGIKLRVSRRNRSAFWQKKRVTALHLSSTKDRARFRLVSKGNRCLMPALPSFPTSALIGVLVVDDYDLVRQGLRLLLGQYPEMRVVGEAWSGAQAVELARTQQPDIVLLDLELGPDHGLDFLPQLLNVCSAKIIVFTGVPDEHLHHHALTLGAHAVAVKGDPTAKLVDCIRRVHAGEKRPFESEFEKIARLTAPERELVALFCEGMKAPEIGARLGLNDAEFAETLASVEDKLEVHSPVQLVVYAFRHGLAKA